ncbi:hypothetical protein TPHA_0I02050 [Tetrapisispora phaffii CBS 4417]|uniref:BZIP domain-containing protein n=1 Tax=Tetrapisispora phaffii (strain ATCC 24235 / CBS 4417 / NBRC 1672 / NRRL Y-8282 / UCD 70-5) TaxID=1071381 RepID=G8BXT1_TETPH|nr:hypothetical protein TPHA_0I02050 [Tetrapisispora phaffii CBS 4417]CCE64709.1 hypothetical protein TPHA_0I02050 [Tetrapisispora phaffii CBS 4417]
MDSVILKERLKPGRKSKKDGNSSVVLSEQEMKARKLLQNRKAQRAFRERKTSRISELADEVGSLKKTIKEWEKKYAELNLKYEIALKEVDLWKSGISSLREKAAAVTLPSITIPEVITPSATPDIVRNHTFKDANLTTIIDNFKPMKAVSLKRQMINNEKLLDESMGDIQQERCVFADDPNNKDFICVCKSLKVPKGDYKHIPSTMPITSITTMKRKFNADGERVKPPLYFNNGSYELDFNEIQDAKSKECCQKKVKGNEWSCEKNCTKLFDEDSTTNDDSCETKKTEIIRDIQSKAMTPTRTESRNS